MFGLFKKKVTPGEFGQAVSYLAKDPLSADAGRSLGARFDDYDASGGWPNFLERRGVPIPTQMLYHWLFTHCAIQAACTQFDGGTRRAMTQGAMAGFSNKPDGYDFETTYTTLEAAYRGRHNFDWRVEPLNNLGAQFSWLPDPNIGVLNAKYLIESFVIPNMKNSKAFIDDFKGYSSTVFASVGTVGRAINHLSKSLKIS